MCFAAAFGRVLCILYSCNAFLLLRAAEAHPGFFAKRKMIGGLSKSTRWMGNLSMFQTKKQTFSCLVNYFL